MLLSVICVFSANAQKREKPDPKMFREIQEYKMKYLAQEMELKEDQKEKFIETYTQFCDSRHKYFEEMRRLEESVKPNASENDYKEVTAKMGDLRLKDAQLEKEYDVKFSKFLTAKQIYKMKEAEEQFRRKMRDMRQKKGHHKK